MRDNFYWVVRAIIFALCLSSPGLAVAQSQTPGLTSPVAKRGEIEHRVQIQLLVASNAANAKTDYPASLEAVVKQLKSSLAFKSHRLVASYIYNVADGSDLAVSDVTYAAFELGGVATPTFLSFGVEGIKLNADDDSIHISKFRFEERKRIYIGMMQTEGSSTARPVVDSVSTGINTVLNVRAGLPTIVGTTASGFSDGVLVVVITINHSGM
jgi:hypothetical protein